MVETMKNKMKEIGKACKDFRIEVLNIPSITEFAKQVDANKQNIYAFEAGRANNVLHLYMYFNRATVEQSLELYRRVFVDLGV